MPVHTSWPTLHEVERAEVTDLLRWNRHLPSPRTLSEREACNRVIDRLALERDRDNAGYVRASKEVGW